MTDHDKTGRKPVSDWVHFKAEGTESGVTIHFDDEGRLVCPQAVPESIVTYRSYDRPSGKEKVVFKCPGGHLSHRALIQSEFDAIAGIDTNDYVMEDGRRLSICASFSSKPVLKDGLDSVWCDTTPGFIIESVRDGINSEVIGWHLYLTYVLPLLPIKPDHKLAVVVDSELDDHPAFNQRNKPYYRDHYLPDNVTLHFATADTGTDLPNKLIKECDRQSREVCRMIEGRTLQLPTPLGGQSDDFAGFAYVNFDTSPFVLEIDWP